MDATDQDKFRVIHKKDYIPELEEQVKYFMSTTPDLPKNDKEYTHVELKNEFSSNEMKKSWEIEQIKRCINGYDGMVGKMYFFYNFCFIRNLSGGRIRPQYRVCDSEWFKLVEECQNSHEWGIICVKRRRVGASWKEASDVLHDCLFNKYFNVGMNSKSERDSIELFKKVKFLYSQLPDFLRVKTTAGNTKMFLDFSYFTKDDNGNKVKKGNGSSILVVAPTDSAYEGQMLSKWVSDEAGKTNNLEQLWSFTEDCLMEETRRVGIPILFGTSGDVGNDGRALKEMWKHSEVYKLKRFFFAGWNGLAVDKCGNDLKEEGIRYIIYERYRRRGLNSKSQNDFVQKYPLTIAEAFQQASTGGVGNIMKINQQKMRLLEEPAFVKKGKFKMKSDGTVIFSPDPLGKCLIYEEPKKIKNGYVAGCDPADHDDAFDEASDLSTYIVKKQHGIESPKIVFEYTDRPDKLNDYYTQVMYALMYYNNTKVLIENNRYRMISHFEERGLKYLLQTTPQGVTKLVGGRTNTIGIRMTNAVKEYLEGLIDEYVEDYCDFIPSEELLQEFIEYGSKNTDRAMAFGVCLIMLKEDRTGAKRKEEMKRILPTFKYRRQGGKIVRKEN